MRASKRWMVAAAAVAVGSSALVSTSASAGPGPDAPDAFRLAGANRFDTAAVVNNDDVNGLGDNDIVIVNGLNFPDGLAAAIYGDAILLTQSDSLPAETLAELEDIADGPGIGDLTIVGGTSAVSSAVYEQLADIAGFDPVRLAGANRYATALAVAEDYGNDGAVILATGENFPDALAAGPLARWEDAPILLNNGPTVRADVAEYLLDPANGVTDVIIVGGEAAIPATVESQLTSSFGLNVERLAGSNRAATAVAIAEYLVDSNPFWGNGVTAVNGNSFADALAAGPWAYDYGYPILLVNQDSIPAATADYHATRCLTIAEIAAIGGTAVISDAVVEGAVDAATCQAPAIVSATLENTDFVQYEADLSPSLSVKAVAGSPADGAVANGWQVALIQNGTPGTEGVAIDTTLTTYALPTFVMTANFSDLTEQGFVNIWNGSPAAALVNASTTNGAAIVPFGGAPAPGALLPLAGVGGATLGSQDSVVVVTFERPVTAAAPSGLYPNLNPVTPPSLGAPDSVDPTPIPVAGATEITYTWDDNTNPAAIPSLPNWQIRFGVGSITDAGSGLANVVAAAETLVAP